MNTILLVTIAFALGGLVGMLASKATSQPAAKKPTERNADTDRLNYLEETHRWLLYNDKQDAWAVMDPDNTPFCARRTARSAVDAAMEKSGG